ncbi:hypothetical protein [Ornithinimicrobium kibberense]
MCIPPSRISVAARALPVAMPDCAPWQTHPRPSSSSAPPAT